MKKNILQNSLIMLTFLLSSVLSAQTQLFVSGSGGINYIPMKEFSHLLSQFNNAKSDEIAFSGNIKLQMNLSQSDRVYLSSEYISNNASYSGGFVLIIWNFESIPVTLGYEYSFEKKESSWAPFLGLGISYVFQNIETKYMGDDGSFVSSTSSNGYGFEAHFGIEKSLIENLFLAGEIKYRYLEDSKTEKYNEIPETNLSGVGLQLGIKFKLL